MARSTPIVLTGLLLAGCSNPFAPDVERVEREQLPPPPEATTAQVVMDNLERAFNQRDKELYETLLDDAFYFTETDCRGDLKYWNDKEEELRIMGPRDGSSQGIFDIYRTITWDFHQSKRSTELGRDHPKSHEDDPDGHPDEDWEVFRGRVEILLLKTADDGYDVDQVMTFKMRQGDDDLWRIRRWMDDPLSTTCDEGESTKPAGRPTWASIKAPSYGEGRP